MSRIGKKVIAVPKGVTVTLDGQAVEVKGPKGQLAYTVPEEVTVAREGDEISFTIRNDTQRSRAMWGLSRTLVNNMVEGVTKGYEEVLELVGVGYRAQFDVVLGQRDVEDRLAVFCAFDQELQRHRRFAGAGIAFEQVQALFRQAAAEDVIEAGNAG